jgi:SAM-dependent methyltransferase
VTEYTFGDTGLAAERLRILDRLYAPIADALIAEVDTSPHLVADLGCGPGATTARLVRRFPAATVTGIDASTSFAAVATANVPSARFVVADVTAPLPGAPFDLIYARFLLAHLPDIAGALQVWRDALAPGGVLVVEESGLIASDDADFAAYERLVRGRIHHVGAIMYAGPLIAPNLPKDLMVVVDRAIPVDLAAGEAAAMFWRNLATWGHDAVSVGLISESDREGLLARLRAREADTTRGVLAWTHHQVIARRLRAPE